MKKAFLVTLALLTAGECPAAPPKSAQSQRIAAKKAALRRQNIEREARELQAQQAYQAKAEAEYKAMLPYMLEAQRQQLQRMSELERNAALHRMAGAAESEAAAYQWSIYQRRH